MIRTNEKLSKFVEVTAKILSVPFYGYGDGVQTIFAARCYA